MSKFCGNCGHQVEDSAAFCPDCGFRFEQAASPTQTTPPPAGAKPSGFSTAAGTAKAGIEVGIDSIKNMPTDKKKKYAPIIVAAAAVVVVLSILISIFAGGYKGTLRKVMKGIENNKPKAVVSAMSNKIIKSTGYDKEDWIERIGYDIEDIQEDFEDELGTSDIHYSYKITDKEKMSFSDLLENKLEAIMSDDDKEYASINGEISLTVELTGKHGSDEYTKTFYVYLYKIGLSWKLASYNYW